METKRVGKLLSFLLIFFTLVLISPFVIYFFNLKFSYLFENLNEFRTTLFRTITYVSTCTLLLVITGFTGAIILRAIPFFSSIGKNLGILILPITLGNISIAFICKLIIGDSLFFSAIVNNGNVIYKMSFIILIQIWQYGLLFIYLYWLNFTEISPATLQYAKANKFSLYQTIKDIYLPHTKNLTILLLFLGFFFSIFDDSKISYLFKASPGTGTEIITNWLARNYHSAILVNSNYAEGLLFRASTNVFIVALINLLILLFIIQALFRYSSGLKAYPRLQPAVNSSNYANKLFALILMGIVLWPLLMMINQVQFSFDKSFSELEFSMLMVLIASLLASVIAISFGIAARLGWQNMLKSFNNKSLVFFAILFLLMLVPPIVITVSGYKWMAIIGYRHEWIIQLSWMIGHTVLSLPILGSFILFTHFRLSNNEISYLRVFKLRPLEIIRRSFILRFKAEYLLLSIIAFSSIWNEGVLNTLFSDYVPSFASRIKMLITGSGADYSKAVGFLIVSGIMSIAAVILWRLIIEKAEKNLENA